MLGNQLIVRRPYTFDVGTDYLKRAFNYNKEREFATFSNDLYQLMFKNKEWFQLNFGFEYSQNYGGHTYMSFHTYNSWDILSSDNLATNSWNYENFKVRFPSGHTYKITKGMSLMKLIKKLIDEFNGDTDIFEDFRIWHSKKLNQKYIDGELCLSIHPLDFMTMSDNDNNWSSCMHWRNGHGDYCTGTLEMLNSPYIIEAYLHNPKKPMDIGNDYEWDNKKWRELFIVTPYILNEIKGYPYQDKNLTNAALMWIKELAATNLGYTYDDEEVNVAENTIMHDDAYYDIDFETTGYMYNDMRTLDNHRARINYKNMEAISRRYPNSQTFYITVPYGGDATCMCCGEPMTFYADEYGDACNNILVCANCEGGTFCPICGRRIYPTDSYNYLQDYEDPVCQGCFDEYAVEDALTHEYCNSDNTESIYWYLGKNSQDEDVVYDYSFITGNLPLDWNDEYNAIFNGPPKNIKKIWYGHYTSVTLDMVNPDNLDKFCELFNLYNDDLANIYRKYDIVEPAATDLDRFEDTGYLDKTENNLYF